MLLRVHPDIPQPRSIARCVAALKNGGIIAYPTDTVYGLGCSIFDRKAIERVYQMKRVDRSKPLALLCADLSHIAEYAKVSDFAYRVMKHVVPGPYTFVLPASRQVPKMLESKRKTIGIRVPDHPFPLAVIRELGHPIISTSVDPEGIDRIMNDPEEIEQYFGDRLDYVVDAGVIGLVPSTVVDLTGPEAIIVREGKGPIDQILS